MSESGTEHTRTCPFCAEDIRAAARKCKHCGEMLDPILREHGSRGHARSAPRVPTTTRPRSKLTFLLLGCFLGEFGVHNFYAGYTGRGVAQLLTTLLTCGVGFVITWVWSLVEICVVTVDADGNEMT